MRASSLTHYFGSLFLNIQSYYYWLMVERAHLPWTKNSVILIMSGKVFSILPERPHL